MACAICKTRRPRRFCPGVAGDICTTCCGTEREVTVACPLDCEYLQDARRHERITPRDPAAVPNPDVEVTEEFIQRHADLLVFLTSSLAAAALATPGAVDRDVLEALGAAIRTNRTMQSGLYYETRPANPLAAAIEDRLRAAAEEFRRAETERVGMAQTRDADVLGVMVFLERLAWDRENGRPRGRAFIDFALGLSGPVPEMEPRPSESGLIL